MSSSKRQPFHFVFTNPATEKERKRESQLARSHTARVNREKRLPVRQPWKASTAAQPKKIVQRAHTYPTPASSETASSGRDERENENTSWDGSQARHNKSWKGSTASTSSAVLNDDSQSWALVLSPRTISPVFGAQSTETFALGASLADTARAANYSLNVLWPNLIMDKAAAAVWFTAFREQPLIFHGFHFALTVHHDLLCNKISWSASRMALMHKTKTIKLLNETLTNLNDDNIDWAILAVLILAANELRPEKLIKKTLLFDPHLPTANWNSVYGKMEHVEEHGRAMFMLIQLRGGLDRIALPQLAPVLAFSDLLNASPALTKPALQPCYWQEGFDDLPWPLFTKAMEGGTGRGFRERVPGGLPDSAVNAYTDLTVIDHVMDQCRQLQPREDEMRSIVAVRNRLHHTLLSVAPWEELDAIDQAIYDRASYECCRLTALLYSNAVLFPVPPHQDWPSKLIDQVVSCLTPPLMAEWGRDASSFLLWVLMLSGIASFQTVHRPFFEEALRQTLSTRNYLLPKPAVRVAVREFLWAESACQSGFSNLWASLDLGAVGELEVG